MSASTAVRVPTLDPVTRSAPILRMPGVNSALPPAMGSSGTTTSTAAFARSAAMRPAGSFAAKPLNTPV